MSSTSLSLRCPESASMIEINELSQDKASPTRGKLVHRGYVGEMDKTFLESSFERVVLWELHGSHRVWISHTERALLTFCEGDLCLENYDTQDAFDAAIKEASDFYTAQ